MKSFRDLIVWQRAMSFAEHVYKIQRGFPAEERYGLCDQLRRAVVSVPSNIAEGHGRDTKKDYIRFLFLAKGSLNEVVTQLELACRLGYLPSGTGLYEESAEIGKMLNALIRKLRTPIPNP